MRSFFHGRSPAIVLLISVVLPSFGFAQVTATYGEFGTGCPGTGIGLGNTQIVPAGANTSFGSGNAIPFGWTPNRYQQVILGAELPTAFTIAAMKLRQPSRGPVAHGFTVDMDIKAGYTTRPTSGQLSTTYASNWDSGAPVQVLTRTQFVFPDQPTVLPTNPAEFFLTIPWTTAFDWVPQPGLNFMLEITIHGNSYGSGTYGYPIDNVSGTVSQYGTPANATTSAGVRTFGFALGLVEQSHAAVPRLYSTDTPQIGNNFRVRISQARPAAPEFLVLGFSNTYWNGVPLPLDVTPLGAPGCSILVAPLLVETLVSNASGSSNRELSIPNDIYLLGHRFYNQAFITDPMANTLGFVGTNGGVGLFGNQ